MAKEKKKKEDYFSRILVGGLFVLALVLLVLVFVYTGVLDSIKLFPSYSEPFPIPDECSLIVGQLVHTINHDGECRTKCRARCEVSKKEFFNSTFAKGVQGCNKCTCTCS